MLSAVVWSYLYCWEPSCQFFFKFTLPLRFFVITATCWDRQLLTNTKGFQTALQTIFECLRQSLKCIQHENNLFCSLTDSYPSSSLGCGVIGEAQIKQVEVVICCKVLGFNMGLYFYSCCGYLLGNLVGPDLGK